MKKKIGILLMLACMAVSCTTAGAAAFNDIYNDEYGKAAEDLAAYGILSGKGEGLFCPDDFVKRSELAKIAVIVSDTDVKPSDAGLFYDVDKYYWANGYIYTSACTGLLKGYPDGSFAPENQVTYAEAITVVLRLLGYTASDIGNNYPAAYIDKAYELGLTKNLYFYPNDPIDRKNIALIISRALMTEKNSRSSKLIEQLDFTIADECVILPGYLTASDEVPTSNGIYKTIMDISGYTGKKVKPVLDDDDNIVSLSVLSDNVETVTVMNINGDDISYISGGAYESIRPASGTKTYYQNSSMPFSSVKSEIVPGMKMMISRDTKNNNPDYIILYESSLSGPYIVNSSLSELNIDYRSRNIIKNGVLSNAEAVSANNAIYYDDECIYIYDNKITGIYEKAYPYKSDVKSITLSGTEYAIETQQAVEKLGGGASAFAINDYITLILGKDGKIVEVQAAKDAGVKYPVVSILSNDIVYIKDGRISSMQAENNWRISYGGSETTFGNIKDRDFENALLTVFYKDDGSFDYGVIDEYDLKGPKTVSGSADKIFDFDKDTLRVVRDGKDAELSDLKTDDIVYYSDIQNTIFAYCDNELGVFEDAYPNKANAKSIKVSGVTYDLETKDVLAKLSGFDKNDYMTLLLGKDGRVADIKLSAGGRGMAASQSKENSDIIYGVLLSCRSGMDDGTRAYYATFMNDNGKEAEYKIDKLYENYIGRAAELVFKDGVLVPKFLRSSDLNGEIDRAGRSIGREYLALDAVIVDVSYIPDNEKAHDGYPAVAKVIELSEITANKVERGQVVSVEYDRNGDISFIAFNNITNSRYKYGMVMDYKNSDTSSWYEIDINGVVKRYTASINADVGRVPAMANIQKGKLLEIRSLTEIKTTGEFTFIDKQRIKIGNINYKLDKDFVIYTRDSNGKRSPINIEDVDMDNVNSVRIYADKELERGGTIRIVVINDN